MTKKQILNNRYQLETRLGLDASRQTWKAIDLQCSDSQNNTVIVKLLAMTPQMQWDESKLFEREAQILQRLNHPRIPQYRDYFVLDNFAESRFTWFALIQSYIPGFSLQQLLDEGRRFTQSEIEKIAIEVLSILVYLHELEPPVLHRDLKPSNLIWGEDDRIYLVDFGSVQDTAVLEGATFTVVGTYGYVPIEQFGGRAVPASDLYALGATLIHLLMGVNPADLPHKDGRMELADSVLKKVQQQTNLDIGLIHWLGKLTEPLVSDRLSSARQAVEALEHRQTLSPPTTSRPPTGSRIQLHQSASHLKIDIPRYGTKALSLLHILGALGGFTWYGLQLISSKNSVLILLGSSAFFLVVFFYACLPALQETSLYFDRQFVRISWKIFGFCYWKQRVTTSKIKPIIGIYEAEKQGAKGITIQAQKARLTTNPMAKADRSWLIEQICFWLETSSSNRSQGLSPEAKTDLKNPSDWKGFRVAIFQSEDRLEVRYPGLEKIGWVMTASFLMIWVLIFAIAGSILSGYDGVFISTILTSLATLCISMNYPNWFPSYAYFDRLHVKTYKKLGRWMCKDKTFSIREVHGVSEISQYTPNGVLFEVSLRVGDHQITYPLGTNLRQSERDLMVQAIEQWLKKKSTPDNY